MCMRIQLQELEDDAFSLDADSLEFYARQLLELVSMPSLTGADLLAATKVSRELVVSGASVLTRDILALLVAVTGELSGAERADPWLGLPGSAAGELIAAVEELGGVATQVAKEDGEPVQEDMPDIDLYVSRFGPGQFPGVVLTKQAAPGENMSSVFISREIGEKEQALN